MIYFPDPNLCYAFLNKHILDSFCNPETLCILMAENYFILPAKHLEKFQYFHHFHHFPPFSIVSLSLLVSLLSLYREKLSQSRNIISSPIDLNSFYLYSFLFLLDLDLKLLGL